MLQKQSQSILIQMSDSNKTSDIVQQKPFSIVTKNTKINDNEEQWNFKSFAKRFNFWKKQISKQQRIIKYNKNQKQTIIPNIKHPKNVVNNEKYTVFTFLPKFFYEQFQQFWNLYFLICALSQLPFIKFLEPIWVGFWYTHLLPLTFVLTIALMREGYDDLKRKRRDYEINSEKYLRLRKEGKHRKTSIINSHSNSNQTLPTITEEQNESLLTSTAHSEIIKASEIKVGDLIVLHENQRVPCDMILLWCSNKCKSTFIRTDQLDGETDWKLRKPVQFIQNKYNDMQPSKILNITGELLIEAPHKKIYEFNGKFTITESGADEMFEEALNLENTLWSSTIVASGTIIGTAIYTGSETRQMLNTTDAKYKIGKIDKELNLYAKLLFLFMMILAVILTFSRGSHEQWYIFLARFILLLSAILPISLRVHMDMSKLFFSWKIQSDDKIPETIVRCTTIPEELGRIQYLFTDKTGTLTQNEMIFKKLHMQPPLMFNSKNMQILQQRVSESFEEFLSDSVLSPEANDSLQVTNDMNEKTIKVENKRRKNSKSTNIQVMDIIEAIALCHNVTPVTTIDSDIITNIDYQASSPDEVALVKFTEECGVTLVQRTAENIQLRIECNENETHFIDYEILQIFPFTSASKRMGIVLRCQLTQQIAFYAKGADSIMKHLLGKGDNEWMEEEVENLAREGLRTLVFAKKYLSHQQYEQFRDRYHTASVAMRNRKEMMESVREGLEYDMELIGVTGVEDKLQENVQHTLEILKNAHIKVWMLTGDKIETAQVIARSSKLVSYGQEMYALYNIKNKRDAIHKLDVYANNANDAAIVVDGESLQIYLNHYEKEFIEIMIDAPVVICCRCSPTQKADMLKLVQKYTKKTCAAIGDGGNDVSMIQRANLGIGILGKEGQQASLAADISITQFQHITRLFLWHGRIAYKNSAKMAQFVIHRGMIIAFMQCLFSVIFYFSAIPIFTGYVMVGYTCLYTVAPVFTMILDKDVPSEVAIYYPELYHDQQQGKSLSHKTMLGWVMRSVFQAGMIMIMSLVLFDASFHNIMAVMFTALIFTEIFNMILEIKKWHWLMIVAEVGSVMLYCLSIFLPIEWVQTTFDIQFVTNWDFWWKSFASCALATVPILILKFIVKKSHPSAHVKLKGQKLSQATNEA